MDINFTKNTASTDVTWEEELALLKEHQRIQRQIKANQEAATVTMKSALPVGIVLTSDWHMGAEGTDTETWEKHMELIYQEPQCFMTTLSNTIDNYLFPSGMFEQVMNPNMQRDFITKFIKRYIDKNKLLAVVGSRCHEGWSGQKSDVDINKLMFLEAIRDHGVPYFPHGGVLKIVLNGYTYSFGLVHKARFHSSLNPTNANKRMFQLKWPVDVSAIAHHHVKEVGQSYMYEGTEYQRTVVSVRTGTYKKNDAYSEGEGFGQGQVGSPMVVIHPDKKSVIPFFDLEDGINYLKLFKKK